MEGRLESTPHFAKHIPRGELVELLTKALLYVEVESHWKGDKLDSNCKTTFSLLEPHICSRDTNTSSKPKPPPPKTTIVASEGDSLLVQTNGALDGKNTKMHSNSLDDDERPAKRARIESEDMDIDDAVSECMLLHR
jgi:transducin (beta)-like 1